MNNKDNDIILSLEHIYKSFPGVQALNDVSLSIRKGEVHALVGENGAGKSTLIKICSGAIEQTRGNLRIAGKEYERLTPQIAKEAGISVIYQEFNLVSSLSVAENIFLGSPIREGIFIDRTKMIEETRRLFDRLQIRIDPTQRVDTLSVGYQQMVEIARALAFDSSILIMDEPSAPLSMAEVYTLMTIIKSLKAQGVAIIYISHRLDEVFEIADRISVLRDGKYIWTKAVEDTTRQDLINAMVGRQLENIYPSHKAKRGEKALEIKNVTGNGIRGITFDAYKGEILGLGGLIGAGRTELAQLLFGVCKMDFGEILLNGKRLKFSHPSDAIRSGISLAPEDRKAQGVLLEMSVSDNIIIPSIRKISKGTIVQRKKKSLLVNDYIKSLKIKTPSVEQKAKNLSGGNQQKLVIAKWLAVDPEVLIFDEPTRGIDIGARFEIYSLMAELAEKGKTILMISSDMEELLGMSDRILVLHEGRLMGELSKEEASQQKVLQLASGMKQGDLAV